MKRIEKDDARDLVRMAIAEDIGTGDITSVAIFGGYELSTAVIISKGSGVMCGGDMIDHVYAEVDARVSVKRLVLDGDILRQGDIVAELSGPTTGILAGERIALNFLQRLCGMATGTRRFVDMVSGTKIEILDTRKTLPGYRKIDKYAVTCGSGRNHRMGLFDMVMIKDNHIKAAGSISEAVSRVRDMHGGRFKIEVEAGSIREAEEAARSGVDIIMLDNMDLPSMREAVTAISKRAKIEVSGNIDENRLRELTLLDIDYVSVGSLTHSVRAFDLSLRFL